MSLVPPWALSGCPAFGTEVISHTSGWSCCEDLAVVGKNLPKSWLGDGTEEQRMGTVAHCKTSQLESFESPVAHSVLEILHQLLNLYFSPNQSEKDPGSWSVWSLAASVSFRLTNGGTDGVRHPKMSLRGGA